MLVGQRVSGAELGEDRDHDAAERSRCSGRLAGQLLLQLLERRRRVALVPGREGGREGPVRRPSAPVCLLDRRELDARPQPVGDEVECADRLQDLEGLGGVAAGQEGLRQRDRGRGVARVELQRLAQGVLVAGVGEALGLRGDERVEELLDRGGRLGADELGDDLAVRKALTAGMPWTPNRAASCWLRVDVDLRQLHRALAVAARPSPGRGRARGRGRTTRPRSRRRQGPRASARRPRPRSPACPRP